MATLRLTNYLDNEGVKYKSIKHPESFTAMETSQISHLDPKNVAKTVIVRTPKRLLMIVLSANHHLDLDLLSKEINEPHLDLAKESEFATEFPDCETGAMPPFGNLYGMEVYVTDDLTKDKKITFNAGTHRELLEIDFKDFQALTHPKIIHVTNAH